MVQGSDVLSYLIPTGGWVIYADDFDSIIYDDGVKPITKKQFDDAFKTVDKIKTDQQKARTEAKSALLEKLGITADEAQLLLG
jgi:hypothetical protein